MQSLSQLENWHDYEVASRREIVALLRGISEKKQLIRMLINGEADVCVTSILDVDPDADALYLDISVNRDQNLRILAATHVLECETSLDKIRIIFGASAISQVEYRGGPAFKVALPETLIRLQRREFYRMPTPVTNPVRAIIPLPPQLGTGTQSFPLADISCGGIALLDNNLVLGDPMGLTFENARIDLPEIGPVTTNLQVRNVIDVTLLNNKTNRRLGCEFINMSRGALAAVQKYITKLERERNARLAGLS